MKLNETIHRLNLKTMISIKDKPTKTKKKMIREMNVAEKTIEIACDRGLGTEDLLKYDVVPSPMLFDDDQLMTKPEKSQLIRELEDKLKSDDYSYRRKPESAFIIDVMAAVRRLPLGGLTNFSNLSSVLIMVIRQFQMYISVRAMCESVVEVEKGYA